MTRRPTRSRYPREVGAAVPGQPVRTRVRPGPEGEAVRYLGRRLLPLPDAVARLTTYTVRAGDRIDLVAARVLGDPTLYWLLVEANGASDPRDLCALRGRRLVVPAPVGAPAPAFDHPRAAARTTVAAPVTAAHDGEDRL